MRRVGILVVSDRASAGQYEDLVGPLVRNIVTRNPGWEIASQAIIPDEHDSIRDQLITWVDDDKLDL
nr:molybdenum cofactor biosynthesis protein [Anaerolineae bacterium]